jgi:sulfate adenylyltransferase large subunit
MATGASNANLAVILVDARNGVLPQSRRHAFISSMLGIKHMVLAVNKMDLVDYSEEVFERIRADFGDYAARLQVTDLRFIPISALRGDNVVRRSEHMPWFGDATLLHYLETVHVASDRNMTEVRFPVQSVIRSDQGFRGYAGQVASGVIRPGDRVMALPSGHTTRIRSIVTYDGDLPMAFPPMAVALTLEDEIDIGRGDMLVPPSHPPHAGRTIDARMVWMHERPLDTGRDYLIKHTTQAVRARIDAVRYRIDVNTLEKESATCLELNDMGAVIVKTHKPLFFDPYRRNRATGSFILIDLVSNATVAAGMITGRDPVPAGSCDVPAGRITRAEQEARSQHRAVTVWAVAPEETAHLIERKLFEAGCRVLAVPADATSPEVALALNNAGVIAILYCSQAEGLEERVRERVGADRFVTWLEDVESVSPLLAVVNMGKTIGD